jgi:hypothetical protein
VSRVVAHLLAFAGLRPAGAARLSLSPLTAVMQASSSLRQVTALPERQAADAGFAAMRMSVAASEECEHARVAVASAESTGRHS